MSAKFIRHPDRAIGVEKLYYFRKTYHFDLPISGSVKIMADARYKLWVNGSFVSAGPCKGNRHNRYYDEVDLTPYLHTGDNLFYVALLNLTSSDDMDDKEINVASVWRSGDGYLYMQGSVTDAVGVHSIETDQAWESAIEEHLAFTPQFFVGLNEHVAAGYGTALTWKTAAPSPMPPRVYGDEIPFGEILSSYAKPRPIPHLYYKPRSFTFHDGYYDAGELTCGYVRLRAHGKGHITATYGECFVDGDASGFVKGDRTDTSLNLLGHDDTFEVDGELCFESFWFRTFRFVRIVTTGEVSIDSFDYAETGYPVEIAEDYDFGSARDNALWAISARTLKRCMLETYVDCPYYEQLQYCMDTYSQTLYTYMVSPDTRLAKRAIDDFAATWRPGYITEARAPSCKRQYIPGFAMFFIYMVNMYEARTEDTAGIKPYMPIVDGILAFFDGARNAAGQIAASDMWDFVDWADLWRADEGAPITSRGEGISIYTMMYAHALRCAARLSRAVGRGAVAEEYLIRADEALEAVQQHCYDAAHGMYANSEKKEQFSQHAQIWAVLTGLVKGEAARELLRRSLTLEAQAGYAYAYLWFRALEKAECYEELGGEMKSRFLGLLDMNCSTIPETPYAYTRSECHAWGAVALYEFTTMTLGVKLVDNSPRVLQVAPRPQGTAHASGRVYTKWGEVNVKWEIKEKTFCLCLDTPDTVAAEITAPRGYESYEIILNGKQVPPHHIATA